MNKLLTSNSACNHYFYLVHVFGGLDLTHWQLLDNSMNYNRVVKCAVENKNDERRDGSSSYACTCTVQ